MKLSNLAPFTLLIFGNEILSLIALTWGMVLFLSWLLKEAVREGER